MGNKRLEDYLRYCYAVEVVPDQTTEGNICYLAFHPELSGCMSHGDTPEDAIANLLEARKLYFATLLEKNLPIPSPSSSTSAIWEEVSEAREEQPIQETEISQKYFVQSEINPIQSLEVDISREVVV